MEELVSLLRVHRSEKDLWDPKNAIARGKTKNQLLRVWEEEKAVPDPKKQKKRVWEIDFHESDPNRRKTNLHNAKKYAIAGLREKKSRVRPAHCYAGREDPRNI